MSKDLRIHCVEDVDDYIELWQTTDRNGIVLNCTGPEGGAGVVLRADAAKVLIKAMQKFLVEQEVNK